MNLRKWIEVTLNKEQKVQVSDPVRTGFNSTTTAGSQKKTAIKAMTHLSIAPTFKIESPPSSDGGGK